jgi:hypothetical protein
LILHSNNNVTVLTDERDKVVNQKRLTNHLPLILEQLSPYASSIEGIVVESTYNWYWLVDGLMEKGHRVHLANTAAIQQYEGLKYTDDDSDARWLAHLFRLGVLPEGYIYPKEERAVRDLLRKRSQLVRQKTANLLSIQNLYSRHTGQSISANRIKQLTSEKVDALFTSSDLALAVKANLTVMRSLETEIAVLERVVGSVSNSNQRIGICLRRAALESFSLPTHRQYEAKFPTFGNLRMSPVSSRIVNVGQILAASVKELATRKMGTSIFAGRLWRILRFASNRSSLGIMRERRPRHTAWWRSRRWRISFPGLVIM